MENATGLQAGGLTDTVSGVPQKPADPTQGATGFDLAQMIAGRRSDDRPARAWRPFEMEAEAERLGVRLGKWTLSRLLTDRKPISERSLRALAIVLDEEIDEVRRAYTMWVAPPASDPPTA